MSVFYNGSTVKRTEFSVKYQKMSVLQLQLSLCNELPETFLQFHKFLSFTTQAFLYRVKKLRCIVEIAHFYLYLDISGIKCVAELFPLKERGVSLVQPT